jgi:hypothetical protein
VPEVEEPPAVEEAEESTALTEEVTEVVEEEAEEPVGMEVAEEEGQGQELEEEAPEAQGACVPVCMYCMRLLVFCYRSFRCGMHLCEVQRVRQRCEARGKRVGMDHSLTLRAVLMQSPPLSRRGRLRRARRRRPRWSRRVGRRRRRRWRRRRRRRRKRHRSRRPSVRGRGTRSWWKRRGRRSPRPKVRCGCACAWFMCACDVGSIVDLRMCSECPKA